MFTSLIFLVVVLAAAAVALEIWIVKKGGKYTGFVLPGLTLLLSILFLYLFMNGSAADVVGYIVTFLLLNIPTIVLLLIYFAASKEREENKHADGHGEDHKKENEEFDSMRIKEL